MSGSASGSSTRHRTWSGLMPMARAARTASWSTRSTATYAFVSITGAARITSASITFVNPTPSRPRPIEVTARLGSARPTFDTLIARKEPRWAWPSHTPSGIAMTVATARDARDSQMCSTVLSQISPVLSPRNWIAFSKVFTSRPPRSQPRGEQALDHDQQGVGHQRQRDREEAGGDELSLEAALDRVEDRLAEPAHADERRDGGEADRHHRRDPDPGHDGRQGERQLQAAEDLTLRQAHRTCRQWSVLGYLAQARQRVPEQDQDRVRHERDLGARDGQAGDRHEQLEERQAGDRVEEGGEDREGRLEPVEAVGDQRGRERDDEADAHGEQGQPDVLHEPRHEHAVEVVEEPGEAELAVLADAVAGPLVVRDDRSLGDREGGRAREHHRAAAFWSGPIRRVIASSRTAPVGRPSSFTTTIRSLPSTSIIERASRRLVSAGAVGPSGSSGGGPRSRSPSVHTRRRLRPRSAPTKSATNSFAGAARMLSGVSY